MNNREVIEVYPELRRPLLTKLVESLSQIKSSKVYRAALWIIGDYTEAAEDIDNVFTVLKEAIGELPFVSEEVLTFISVSN
jgi:coatomer subunit beta